MIEKVKFLLEEGDSIYCYSYASKNLSRIYDTLIVKYNDEFFFVDDDSCEKIDETRAKKLLSNNKGSWETAQKLWEWENWDEYFKNSI